MINTRQAGRKATRKLSAGDVRQMRELYGEGATQGALARHFGMSIGQVGRIVRGESWAEGAGERTPTQAEFDGILQRLQMVQARVNERTALGPEMAELAAEFAGKRATPPPSMLEEGEEGEEWAEGEGEGQGLAKLQERARLLGAGDALLAELKGEEG